MADQPEFDVARVAASAVVVIGMLFAAVHMLPFFIAALYAVVPPVLILWLIVMALRTIIRGLLP